jgi:trans-2,3-dihydro-3-hydroxyanthranilate isomerase
LPDYSYRVVNVFTIDGDPFSGNPLCVFEDALGLDDATMQALALQFNLSETTFVLPSEKATARVRIFTPAFEMPFAGHPTLGTAHVVRAVKEAGDAVTLEMKAGLIPVSANGDEWTLQANAPTSRAAEASKAQLAQMLGIAAAEVDDVPLWVNTGSEQLIIPLTSADAVRRCAPDAALLQRYGHVSAERYLAYVWAELGDGKVEARFFFPKGAAVAEDPATGSACANLGGWFLARQAKLPVARTVRQGDAVKRPSRLGLRVDKEQSIYVSGEVVELGRGVIKM